VTAPKPDVPPVITIVLIATPNNETLVSILWSCILAP
jgi:hypothetical protein